MKTEKKDKILSATLLILSGAIMLFGLGNAGLSHPVPDGSLTDIFIYIVDSYFDILLISYIFICLQIAGYVELKYKQDYITMCLVSVFLTPFALIFILPNEK